MFAEGQTLADGRYELFEPLGSGGMATVFRAMDHRLGVGRAIKVLLPAYAEKPRVRARFEAEARTMAILDHPSIVRVYDVGSNDETAWIVMEIVEGGSLLHQIGVTGMSEFDCLRHTARVLEGLAVAHSRGVIHRDIKPHNVLIDTDGQARITDFGIARSAGFTEESFTKTGTVMGTWAFMAPEQRQNAKGVDHTVDLYGMGATLFAMATGQTPMDLFAADLDPEMLDAVPASLMPIIRNATFYQREKRYTDATAMLDDVRKAQQALNPTPPTDLSPTIPLPSEPTQPIIGNGASPGQTSQPEATPINERSLNTPLPYRPSPPQPHLQSANTQPLETSPTDTTPPPKKRNDQILYYLIIILVLLVGVSIKKSIKQTQDVALAPALELATAPKKTDAAPAVPTPAESSKNRPTETIPAARETARPPPAKIEPPKQQSKAERQPSAPSEAAPKTDSPRANEPAAPNDRGPASISNSTGQIARIGGFLPLQAKLLNVRPIDIRTYRVTAYYRAVGTAAYKNTELSRTKTTWTGSIQITPEMEGGLEYFLRGKSTDPSGRLTPLESGSKTRPHRVKISSP